jgi:uncharacterized protein
MIADKVRFLSRVDSYPDPTRYVRVIETHMSWVFVTDELVYKMKKPIRLPFLDFSTLANRRYFCEESIRLNRRLAASVYLGVVPLTLDDRNELHLGGPGVPVEWLEKMWRLPDDAMLDAALARGAVSEADVRRFVGVLARFYRDAVPEPISVSEYLGRLAHSIDDNLRALDDERFRLDPAWLRRLGDGQREFLNHRAEAFEARVRDGRIVEAHGDLRPEHVCLLPEPVFIDCLEFNRSFRVLDVADELSYLAMECELLGAPFVTPVLFDTYHAVSGDRVPEAVRHFYASLRAVLRAKLAAWHLDDAPRETHAKWLARARSYLDLADRHAVTLAV